MTDLESGSIGIVKDQFRLSINYLQTGMLMGITYLPLNSRQRRCSQRKRRQRLIRQELLQHFLLVIQAVRRAKGNVESESGLTFHTDI